MKTSGTIFLGLVAAIVPLAACEADGNSGPNVEESQGAIVATETCGTTAWELTAGQTIDVGSVTVSNDADNLYVTYGLDYPGATFGTLHLWVGDSLLSVPSNPQGIPIPGQFCQAGGGSCADASGLTSYTFAIPFVDLNIVDVKSACGLPLYVVTHAEVNADTNGDGQVDHETAFGGPVTGSGNRWWYYGQYQVCCDFGEPDPAFCTTAFAKGSHVWTTDKKSNPENLPSLSLTKNRWGWAIALPSTGHFEYPIYAGAGLNNISKGTLVGRLSVDYDGSAATVSYAMFEGYYLGEVHLYAGDASPMTIAPGQYGYLDSFDPRAESYEFQAPLVDENGVAGVWLVAHAVVCNSR